MKWTLLLLLFHAHLAWSVDQVKSLAGYDPVEDAIADNYEAGPFLIYDCQEKHWVCVLESYYKECGKKRLKDGTDKRTHHSCAPIGEFPTKKSCFQRMLYMTTHNHGTRFCVKDEWKNKAVK